MNTRAKITASIFITVTIVIFFMYLHAEDDSINYGPFSRKLLKNFTTSKYSQSLEKKTYYIAGYENENILLGNAASPNEITYVNISKPTAIQKTIKRLYTTEPDTLKASEITIDSKNIYVSDLITGKLYTGKKDSLSIAMHHQYREVFAEAIPINRQSIVLRTINKSSNKFAFTKLAELAADNKTADPLEKQVDGLFCTDGMLRYSGHLKRLIYVHYYRNQFICMDTSLQIQYKSHTIDTITKANVTVAYVNSTQSRTQSTPGLIVNRKSCVDEQYLYINSSIMGEGERINEFKQNSVIDVYNLHDGSYQASFYLPNIHHVKLTHFKIFGSTLIAIHGKYLAVYNLNTSMPQLSSKNTH